MPKQFILNHRKYRILKTVSTKEEALKEALKINRQPYEHNPVKIKQLSDGSWAIGTTVAILYKQPHK